MHGPVLRQADNRNLCRFPVIAKQSVQLCVHTACCCPTIQCCAGLGWIAVGVKGPADLRLWVHEGVGVTTHASMLPDYAQALERPGFSSSNLKAAVKGKDKSGKVGSK